jgi:hypothetical protein
MKEQASQSVYFPELTTQAKTVAPKGPTNCSSLDTTIQENLDRYFDQETKEKRKLASQARKILGVHKIT